MSTVKLAWTNPIARKDDTALNPSDIASVDVFDDIGDGNGPVLIGSPVGAATEFTSQTLSVGMHTFTVVVNDDTGHRSAPSNAAQVFVPATQAAPNAVSDLAATLIEGTTLRR